MDYYRSLGPVKFHTCIKDYQNLLSSGGGSLCAANGFPEMLKGVTTTILPVTNNYSLWQTTATNFPKIG